MDKILLALSELRAELKHFFSSASTVSTDLIKDLKAQLATASASVAAHETTIKDLQAAAALAATALGAKDSEIVILKADLATANAKVTETLASLGVDPQNIPAGKAESPPPGKGLVAQYAAITDPTQRVAFYRANKAAIDAAWGK